MYFLVVAGSPHESITRSIASDLERRGFIVYVTVSSEDEVQIVRSENRLDILPLWMDLTIVSRHILRRIRKELMSLTMAAYRQYLRQKYIRLFVEFAP